MSDVKFSLYEKGLVEFIGKKGRVVLASSGRKYDIANANRNNLSFLKIMVKMRQPDYETMGKILESKVDAARQSDEYYKKHHDEDIKLESFVRGEQTSDRMDLVRSFEYKLLSGLHILQIKDSLTDEKELDALAEAYLNVQDVEHLKSLGMESMDASRFEALTLDPCLNDRAYNCMSKSIKKRTI